jgi:hypothetical protein
MRVLHAVPDIACLLGIVRDTLAQAEELKLECAAQPRLRIRQDRLGRIDAARQ